MHCIPFQDFFTKYALNKIKICDLQRSSNCRVTAKFCPMLVETPYFGGVINPKTYLYYELGSNFFPSCLAYKLVNLFFFEKILCKMSKN